MVKAIRDGSPDANARLVGIPADGLERNGAVHRMYRHPTLQVAVNTKPHEQAISSVTSSIDQSLVPLAWHDDRGRDGGRQPNSRRGSDDDRGGRRRTTRLGGEGGGAERTRARRLIWVESST